MRLIPLPILFFLLVFEHGEIGIVAGFGDVVTFEGFEDGTVGFVGMGTVVETAIVGEMEDLFEVMSYFFAFHVESTKALDAGSINYRSPLTPQGGGSLRIGIIKWGEIVHLGEGGGMFAGVVGIGNLGSTEVKSWDEGVDEGGFAHTAIATEKGNLALETLTQFVYALSGTSGDFETWISYIFVEVDDCIEVGFPIDGFFAGWEGIQDIYLVKYKGDWDAICFGTGKETVDEGKGRLWLGYSHNEEAHIYVGCYDMRLLGEIGGLTNDVVLAIFKGCDKSLMCLLYVGIGVLWSEFHSVTYGYWIGGSNATNAEVALDFAVKDFSAFVSTNCIGVTCIFYYETGQGN